MKNHYPYIVKSCDKSVSHNLCYVVRDKNDPNYGGVENASQLVEVVHSLGAFCNFASSYFCEESIYYKNPELLADIENIVRFVQNVQRPNKTVDYLETNFFTPPSFEIHAYIHVYRMFKLYRTEVEEATFRVIEEGLADMAEGLYNGGFHTPNHRWVESAGLLAAYNELGWPKLKDKAMLYLAEGIDIDEFGEFTERSPGIYNAVNDNALLMVAEEAQMPELYNAIKLNMELLFSYLEPDGSIFTQNSTRQDKGEGSTNGSFFPANYYHIYLWAALIFGDNRYAGFADAIFRQGVEEGRSIPGVLWLYMLKPELKEFNPPLEAYTEDYEKFYPGSNIFRKKSGKHSVSLIANNPNFLFVQQGNLKLYMRVCSSFFAVAQFVAGKVEQTAEGYRMTYTGNADYRWPFETPPPTSDWHQMDHDKRKRVNITSLTYTIDFVMLPDGVSVKVHTDGCDRVPFKMEFAVSPNCTVSGKCFTLAGTAGNHIAVSEGDVKIISGMDTIKISDSFCKHIYHAGMRGSIPKSRNDFTIYFTDFTPVDRMVNITCSSTLID